MSLSEIIQFCSANASRSDRVAKSLHEPGLKARYIESANHWRQLAEQIKEEGYQASLRTLALPHSVERRVEHKQDTRPEHLQIENLGTVHDANVTSVTKIDAHRDPLTGEWDASFRLSRDSADTPPSAP